jgi:hypothetical protein
MNWLPDKICVAKLCKKEGYMNLVINEREKEQRARRTKKVRDLRAGEIFVTTFTGYWLMLTDSQKDEQKIAVDLETGESVFLDGDERVTAIATKATLDLERKDLV